MSKFKLVMISSIVIAMIVIFMMILPIFMVFANPTLIFAALAFIILGLFIIFKIIDYVDNKLKS